MGEMADLHDYGYWPDDEAPRESTCKYCGARGLWWVLGKRDRYVLKNPDDTPHNCLRVPASPDEFDVV